jgi:hypothetical protein
MSITDSPSLPEPFKVGEKWFFRTVTFHVVGEITELCARGFVRLKDAAWVADTERFTQAIEKGALREVEPVGAVVVNTGAVTDAFPWTHSLPLKQK